MNVFSCIGVPNKQSAKIVHTGNEDEVKPLQDSLIGMCKFCIESSEDAIAGTIYACNFDKTYLETKSSKIPMLRIIATKHTSVSMHYLADISVWFFPTDIKDIKLMMTDNKYSEIILKGEFKMCVNTLNDNMQIKDTVWINELVFDKNGEKFMDDISKHSRVLNIIDHEWTLLKKSLGV